jgi:isoamylase
VLALRARQQRNFLATLLLSQGVPMLLAGDEIGRTQYGNNNAYCQDNELSWMHWPFSELQPGTLAPAEADGPAGLQAAFTRQLIRLRADHPVFRRRRFFTGATRHGSAEHTGDIAWLRPDSSPMCDADWDAGFAKSLAVFLNGDAISEPGQRGEPIVDDSFLLMFNAAEHDLEFTLPPPGYGEQWVTELDTADPRPAADPPAVKAGEVVLLAHRSMRVLRRA